jgi:hypothetical protein
MLCNIDERNEGYTYASRWFNVCHNGLDIFEEGLTLNDIVTKDEATQVEVGLRCSRAIDKPGSFNRRRRHRYIDELC